MPISAVALIGPPPVMAIAKSSTDPAELTRRAIDALIQKKDDRANKLILQLIDRP